MPRPLALPEPWRSLALRHGGEGRLSTVLAVGPRSVYRWAHGGSRPIAVHRRQLRALFGEAGLETPTICLG